MFVGVKIKNLVKVSGLLSVNVNAVSAENYKSNIYSNQYNLGLNKQHLVSNIMKNKNQQLSFVCTTLQNLLILVNVVYILYMMHNNQVFVTLRNIITSIIAKNKKLSKKISTASISHQNCIINICNI